MKKYLTLLLIIFTFIACKNPQARRPVSVKSGSFINKSVELNKKINNEQHKLIQQIIQKNP